MAGRDQMAKPSEPAMFPAIMTRRRFVTATLAAGFALAVRPICAATITTDEAGLTAGEIRIPTHDGHIPAYRARPDNGPALSVVLVVQEIFGIHEHIKDVCRRFAKLGYVAIAPELFARQGDVSKMTEIDEIRSTVVSQVPDAQVLSDLDAAVAWAKESGEGDIERLGITGFCWGGRIVWLYAAHNPRLKAGVAWYGRLIGNPTALQPKHPIDVASMLKSPVLGLYGAEDKGIPVDQVEQMKRTLQAAGGTSEFVVYPNAPHAFYADYRPSYRKDAAEDGWMRLQDWFERHGVA
ncbi:MAG: putative hydrolase [Nitrospira sp.]